MSKYIEPFKQAILERHKVKVIINRKTKSTPLIATCAPLDFGPSRNSPGGIDQFHFYKYAWKHHAAHNMSIDVDRLIKLTVLDEAFDPAEFIDWDVSEKPWLFPRNWGVYS